MLEEQKIHYDAAKELVSVIKVLMQPEDIVKQYQDAAKEMKLAGDYEDAKKLEKYYREAAVKAEAEGKEKLYQNARTRMENAKKDVQLMLAKQTFERVQGYKDADHLAEECEKMIESMKKKSTTKSWLEVAIVVVVIVALMFGVVRMDQKEKTAENQTETTQMTETEETT